MPFTSETQPVARKAYHCDGCRTRIEPGTRYLNSVGLGDVTNWKIWRCRYCAQCAEWMGRPLSLLTGAARAGEE